jgi:hypothetical protein
MTRNEALPFVSFALDDALNVRRLAEIPADARLVGWQCGFEPLFVAVWSYLPGLRLDADTAAVIALDYLAELDWFADGTPREADYVI